MPQNESVYADMEDSEKEVAEYLKQLRIYWIYESPIFVYDEKGRPRVWTPDFYLPQFGIYIEVCGSEDFDYEYRKKIYQDNQIHVIYLHWYKDKDQWKNHFNKKLLEIEEYRHSTVMQMINKLL